MKHSNQHIRALARKLFHQEKGIRRVKLMHPDRDWLLGVLAGVMIILTMIGWSAYTYLEQRSAIELDETNMEAEIPVYKGETIEDALELFANRKEAFTQLNQTSTPVVETPVGPVADVGATSSTDEIVEESDQAIAPTTATPPTSTDTTFENDEPVETPTLVQ